MSLLIYGANGYTGRLITKLSATYDIKPILAGRDETSIAQLAAEHSLPYRIFAVEDAHRHLGDVSAVLHCAGPFAKTYGPMVRACIGARVHYLDITGEIEVFEGIAALNGEAANAKVMLLPGTGYDVVPTDCLALYVAKKLPDAVRLYIAISGSGRLSRGTLTTAIEKTGAGGAVRREGHIVKVPPAWKQREIDFGKGPRSCVTIPWGDVSTAWHSTGIPDIEVYASMPASTQRALRATKWLGPILRNNFIRRQMLKRIRSGPAGPSERELREGESRLWARVENAAGDAVEALLIGPNGYQLTAHSALLAARRALDGDAPVGFQTPARAYGADFVMEVPGVQRVG